MPRSRTDTSNLPLVSLRPPRGLSSPRYRRGARGNTGAFWTVAVAGMAMMLGAMLAGAARAAAPLTPGTTIKVGYSSSYVFDEDQDSMTYWNKIKHEFEAAHPGVTLQLQPHGGTDTDEMNAIALQFRSPVTAPDVIQLPTTYIGQFESSGYLLALDKYLGASQFWSRFPKNIQDEGRINGHVFAVDIGENNTGIYYNKGMLQKAGVAVPWQPHINVPIIVAMQRDICYDAGR